MPGSDEHQSGPPEPADFRPSRRAALTILFLSSAGFVFLEPSLIVFAVAGFVLAAIYLYFLLPEASPRGSPSRNSAHRRVWPDRSLKAMADALSYPAYLIGADGKLRYVNNAGDAAFGPAAIGEPVSYKFRNPVLARVIAEAIEKSERREAEYQDEVPQQRWFHMDIAPVPNARGARNTEFFLLSFLDLTQIKRADQMRSDFIANASHELRTPLASVRGFIETIKGPAADDPAAIEQFLTVMLEQAERMSRLIDDLLSLSRIEMKAHVPPQEEVDLVGVLGHVCDSLEPMALAQDITLNRQIDEPGLVIRGDHDELIQVFENLLENACKYGGDGKQIDVSARRLTAETADGDDGVQVEIRDYGAGIPEEHLPRLTERFYRVDIESSREKRGTGLGLAIVKHILMRHGTRLNVSSTMGEGAAFSVIFAAAPAGRDVDETVKNVSKQ